MSHLISPKHCWFYERLLHNTFKLYNTISTLMMEADEAIRNFLKVFFDIAHVLVLAIKTSGVKDTW